MSSDTQQIDDRQFYENLTEKQQAVVDAIAADRMADDGDLAEGEDFSRSYVNLCRRKFGHIIEDRERQLNNSHETTETERGQITIEGGLDMSDVQAVTERPVKDAGNLAGEIETETDTNVDADADIDAATGEGEETAEAGISGPLAAVLPDGIGDVFEAVDPDEFDLRATDGGVTLSLSWGETDE